MPLNVTVITPRDVIFEGEAESVLLPGEAGVFEVLPYHKRLISRLVSGDLFIDHQSIKIRRGAVKVNQNKITVIIEE